MNIEFEWRGRTDFAEFAEALGIETDCIAAAGPIPENAWAVLYSTEHAEDPLDTPMFTAWLARDADGILVVTHRYPSGSFRDFLDRDV